MAAQRHAARPSSWRPHGASSAGLSADPSRPDHGAMAGHETAGRGRRRGPGQRADQLLFRIVVICASAALAARPRSACRSRCPAASAAARSRSPRPAHFGPIGANQLFCAAAVRSPRCRAAPRPASSSAVALGSAPLAISRSGSGGGEVLDPLRGQRLVLALAGHGDREPPRNDGRRGAGRGARQRHRGDLALDGRVDHRRVGGSLGSFCCDWTAPSSQPLPYRKAAWPWAKIASWSFSSLVGSPLRVLLLQVGPLAADRPPPAGCSSVPAHLPSAPLAAIWPPSP